MPELIYSKYSNDRDEKFNIITDIVQNDDGTKYILKRPFSNESENHIKGLLKNGKVLTEKYKNTNIEIIPAEDSDGTAKIHFIEGTAFSNYLDELLFAGKHNEWEDAVKRYFSNIFIDIKTNFTQTEEFKKVFGDVEIPEDEPSVSNIDIDLLFSNIFYKDGIWTLYDYEWAVNFDVPINFLIYRTLHYYIETQMRLDYITDQIYYKFGLTDILIEQYKKMEDNFQLYVKGANLPLWELYNPIHGDIVNVGLLYEVRKNHITSDYSKVQLYLDYGDGFSEENSNIISNCIGIDNIGKIHVDLNYETKNVRIDPCAGACIISDIAVKAGDRLVKYSTNGIRIDKNKYIFLHNDPQILISTIGYESIDASFTLQTIESQDRNTFIDLQSFIIGQQDKIEIGKKELAIRENEYQIELSKKQDALMEAHKSIHEYSDSMSWKITKPLRSLKGKISSLRHKDNIVAEEPESGLESEEDLTDFSEEDKDYQTWIKSVEEQNEKIDIDKLSYQPKISVLVPVYNVSDEHLSACIESVITQDYQNWELCLADDCSTWENVRETLKKYENNEKIKITYRPENGHISECTNTALNMATGEFIALLDCDDILAPNALSEVVFLLNEDKTLDFIYSDEDKIDEEGINRHNPHFKQDWAPDTFMAIMYTCHLAVYRRSLALEIGGFRKGYEGAQDYDFTLRFTEKTNNIGHIPKILYHWRERRESTASDMNVKLYALKATAKSKEDALKRRGLKGNLEYIEECAQYRVNYIPEKYPKVSIIIPSKDNFEYLERCLRSFTEKTDYPDYELIIIDNGSNDENKNKYEDLTKKYNALYIYEKRDFNFSAMCNRGSEFASGKLLLFLNDDTEIINADWLRRMAGQAVLDHTGAVGAKLLYPNTKSIQHVGVVGTINGPIHAFGNFPDEAICYYGRNILTYNNIAVTGACIMISKMKFDEVGGFDENLKIAFNDIDLCFKLTEKGYYNVVRNDAVLIHHESVSRGYDQVDENKRRRLYKEKRLLYTNHPQFWTKDPFYNPNLTQSANDFSFNYNRAAYMTYSKLELIKGYKYNAEPTSILYNIDEANVGYFEIIIRGWAVVNDQDMSNYSDMSIIFENENNQYYKAKVNKLRRVDVDKSLHGKGKYKDSGFVCQIKREDIPEGEYKIGLEIGDKTVMTANSIMVN